MSIPERRRKEGNLSYYYIAGEICVRLSVMVWGSGSPLRVRPSGWLFVNLNIHAG